MALAVSFFAFGLLHALAFDVGAGEGDFVDSS